VRDAGEHFSRRMLLRAIRSNQAILFSSSDGSQHGGAIPTARSSICAPLVGHQTTLGVLYLDVYSRESEPFTHAHLQMVSLAAYFFSIYLERERAVENKRESERLSSAGLAVFGAAHHIKNIMTSLQGSSQLIDGMVKRRDFTCLPETWGVMQRSIDRITRAVGEMLNFAKEEHFESRPLDLPRLVEELVTGQRGRAQLAGVKLELFLERRSLTVMGDSQRIEEVIENLLTNAIECFDSPRMPVGRTPTVKVSMRIVGVRFVLLEVADNGPGIPPDSQRKIFDLFHTTKGAKGNGLGLAISRKHIRQHGGSLSYKTSTEGTIFRISLPLPGNDMDLPTNTAH
jgi:signal transduction histidine kinase